MIESANLTNVNVGSMSDKGEVYDTHLKFTLAKDVLKALFDGIIQFSDYIVVIPFNSQIISPLYFNGFEPGTEENMETITWKIDQVRLSGEKNFANAFKEAFNLLSNFHINSGSLTSCQKVTFNNILNNLITFIELS